MEKKSKPVNMRLLITSPHARRRSLPPPPPAPAPSAATVKVNVWVSPQASRRAAKAQPVPTADLAALEPDDDDDSLEEDTGSPIQVLVAPKTPVWQWGIVRFTVFWLFWAAIASGVAASSWVAARLILNPGSVPWLSGFMPGWNHDPLMADSAPRSLDDIRDQLAESGLHLGRPQPVTTREQQAIVIPVLAPSPHCTPVTSSGSTAPAPSCPAIQELRVYQGPHAATHRNPTVTLVDRISVSGPSEATVVAPLELVSSTIRGSSQPLPWEHLEPISGTAPTDQGDWFQLVGTWQRGRQRVIYGQVVYYDPHWSRLVVSQSWVSPAGERAHWQNITGSDPAELVIDQSIGLEPAFQAFAVRVGTGLGAAIQFEAISLERPALDLPAYNTAIALARNGLWFPAQNELESIRQQRQTRLLNWPAAAQAQLDLIALHAQVTQAQAEQRWASPSQTLTAQLIDGRWAAALSTLQTALADGYDVTRLLQDDGGRLWRRINAALQVNPRQPDVLGWGALVLTARQDRASAIAWLQQRLQQGQTAPVRFANLDHRLQQALGLMNQLSDTSQTAADRPLRLVGSVERLSTITDSAWLRPQMAVPLQLASGQSWYQVTLSTFHDGRQWQRSPFTLQLAELDAPHQLWNQLGLAGTPSLNLQHWSADGAAQTFSATVQAARYSSGRVHLLVAGPTVPTDQWQTVPPPLALTADTIYPQTPSDSLTLAALHGQNPEWVNTFIPAVQRQFAQTGLTIPVSDRPSEDGLGQAGDWGVQLIDLTDNQQPEALLKFQPPTASGGAVAADSPAMRTVIISDAGEVLYSDVGVGPQQSLVAIAQSNDDGPPLLIIAAADGYRVRRWSPAQQQFE